MQQEAGRLFLTVTYLKNKLAKKKKRKKKVKKIKVCNFLGVKGKIKREKESEKCEYFLLQLSPKI
jgi:hypothetical protein